MDRRARLLSPASTPRGVLLFLIGFWFVVSAAATPLWSLVGPEAQIFSHVNELRRARHLEPLRANPALAKVALAHANEMARNNYLSHVNLGGEDPLARVRAAGIEGFKLLAENIASSAAAGDRISAVIEEWLRSPSHRENLLNPAFNTTGLGVVETPDGHTLVVELFATF
jgi:uncharacterized protein YkwD